MEKNYKGTLICAVRGDLSRIEGFDALTLGATEDLYIDSGVCRAIHTVAGPELREAVEKLGRCELGEAKITPAFNAPAKAIVHVAVPKWYGGDQHELETLFRCYRSVFLRVAEWQLRSVAVPSLGTGVYRYPTELAAETGIRAAMAFVDENPGCLDRIEWVLFDEETLSVYERMLEKTIGA